MKKYLVRFAALDLPYRFMVVGAILLLFTGFSAQRYYINQERNDLELRLQEKSAFLNNFYAFLIADSLMRKDDITLLQVINRLEEDQEISSVVVVDQRNEIRYHIDPEKIGIALNDPQVKNVLQNGQAYMTNYENGGHKALMLVSPLRAQGVPRPIGAVRIDFTYRRIEKQLSAPNQRYWFIILGALITCGGILTACVHKWVVSPLRIMENAILSVNPALPELRLPSFPAEFGKTAAALVQLVQRVRAEMNQQTTSQTARGEQEKLWVQQMAKSLFPGSRLLVADKDNRLISDSANGSRPPVGRPHLMDLITDSNFANLLNTAFQKEGEAVRGPVTFQDKNYGASILSVPLSQSVVVKTIIALQPK